MSAINEKIENRPYLLWLKANLNKVFLFAVLLCFLTVTIICVAQALTWINKPFPGFLYNERVAVAPVGQYHWTGTQAGLKYPDKILKADGKPIESIKDLEKTVKDAGTGEPIVYTVERGDHIFTTTVSTMRFAWTDLLMTFGSLFLEGIAYMLIGVIVFVMKPNLRVSWIFLTVCLFLSLWSITIFDMQATHFGFIRFYLMATALIPGITLHFCIYFPEPRPFILKYPRLQILPYLISFAILVPMEIIYPHDGFQLFWSLALVYIFISTTSLIYPSTYAYFKSDSVIARQRAKILLLGAALAFPLPVFANLSQQLLGSFLGLRIQTNFLALPLIIFPACIAYAIAKHNLFDVDVYIKRAVGYAIMTAIVVCVYLGISIPLNVLVGKYQIAQSRAFPILFTLGVIVIFNPLRDRIQAFVDRIFFRLEYNYQETVQKISETMRSLLNQDQICRGIMKFALEPMFVDSGSVMILSKDKNEYECFIQTDEREEQKNLTEVEAKASLADKRAGFDGDAQKEGLIAGETDYPAKEKSELILSADNPLIKKIAELKKEVTIYDLQEDSLFKAEREAGEKVFGRLGATLILPLIYEDRLSGLISLGQKKSGKFYRREDINLLNILANQGAMAIENARMVEEVVEKERMEEELNIARDLQVSMLPAECPQIEGFEIAAYSVSAREVGGDFYDFIDMGSDIAGMVIGDVTGKSVSGALVMSASRSVFRMLSEEELTVAESMIRANRRLKRDVKTGMFVALLFAVLSSQDRTMTLCSAGQTQPVLLSAKTAEASLVETRGDTFPLGILDDAAYEETQLKMEPGDKVVLYTDGIVEAMNEQEEMFGFDRLLKVVKNSQTMTAETLLEEIKNKVNEFAGSAPQHDDITIIVIQATE